MADLRYLLAQNTVTALGSALSELVLPIRIFDLIAVDLLTVTPYDHEREPDNDFLTLHY